MATNPPYTVFKTINVSTFIAIERLIYKKPPILYALAELLFGVSVNRALRLKALRRKLVEMVRFLSEKSLREADLVFYQRMHVAQLVELGFASFNFLLAQERYFRIITYNHRRA